MKMTEEFEAMLTKHLNEKYKTIEMNGIMIGWNACLASINEQIKDLHNAKKIKQFIKDEISESHKRIETYIATEKDIIN